jgi:hypothetical protein
MSKATLYSRVNSASDFPPAPAPGDRRPSPEHRISSALASHTPGVLASAVLDSHGGEEGRHPLPFSHRTWVPEGFPRSLSYSRAGKTRSRRKSFHTLEPQWALVAKLKSQS